MVTICLLNAYQARSRVYQEVTGLNWGRIRCLQDSCPFFDSV